MEQVQRVVPLVEQPLKKSSTSGTKSKSGSISQSYLFIWRVTLFYI